MAWWIPAAISTAVSLFGSRKGQDAAEAAGKYNAAAIRSETAEAVRRAEMQKESTLGTAAARVGGSGVQMTGTPQNYMSALDREITTQTDWMAKSGELRAQSALRGGQQAASQINYSTIGNVANTWSSAFQSNWWGAQSPSSGGGQ